MELAEQKKELRKRIKSLKNQLTSEEKTSHSGTIFRKIEASEIFKKSKIMLVYWSIDDEVSTHEFVKKWSKSKIVLLPVIQDNFLILKEFSGEQSLVKSEKLTLMEPVGNAFSQLELIDLVIVPGVAFDSQNNRLGRGKGYYDKLLPLLKAYKIGVCFTVQLVDELPYSEKDVKMDTIITEQSVY